jgi:hypothetical protein
MGTPKGENQFYDFFKLSKEDDDWFSLELKASDTGIIPADEIERMKKVMTQAQYEQELECSFSAPVLGAYYAGIIEVLEQKGQIAPEAAIYDPAFPVSVVADLGFTDSCAWWFWQLRPDGIAIIDHYENQSQPLQHYFDVLDDRGYEYDTIWLPHDARARTLQTGRSTVEQFIDKYKKTPVKIDIVPSLKLQHGIDAARLVLPNCWFNQINCQLGIEALRSYRRKYDPVKNVFSNEPMHSWHSNSSDSFRYLSLVCKNNMKDLMDTEVFHNTVEKVKPTAYNLHDLFAEREKFLKRRRARI